MKGADVPAPGWRKRLPAPGVHAAFPLCADPAFHVWDGWYTAGTILDGKGTEMEDRICKFCGAREIRYVRTVDPTAEEG